MRPTTNALAAAALLLAATPAAAQTYAPGHVPPARSFEITPFAGYSFGGELDSVDYDDDFFFDDIDLDVDEAAAFGVIFDARLTGGLFLELWASRQETELSEIEGLFPSEALFDLEVDYYHAGLLYEWTPGHVHPFFTMSAGATRLKPDGAGLDDLVRPSFSIGGGAKVMFSEAVGLRLEGRLLSTWIEEDADELCDVHFCYDFDEDVYFSQIQAGAGLVIAF